MIDPATVLTSKQTLTLIDELCRKQFPDPNLADECSLYVLEKLQADDCQRLRAYTGQSSLPAFLRSVINSLTIDFRRHKFGRKRVPQAVSRLGKWAEEAYKLVCWRFYSLKDAFEVVSVLGLFHDSYASFTHQLDVLHSVPCRTNPTFVPFHDEQSGPESQKAYDSQNPLEILLRRLDGEHKQAAVWAIEEATAELSDEDQLFVRLVFGREVSAAAAGRTLGLKPAQARKKKQRLLRTYKEKLLSRGISMGQE